MANTKLSGLQVPEQSIDLALAHIAALTGDPNAVVDIRLLHDSDAGAPAVPLRGALRDLWPEVLAWQAKGYGCFFTVNATDGAGRTAHHVVAARAAWVDLDGIDSRQQYEAAAAFDPPPTFAVSTSPDRWHIYWTLPPGASPDRAEALNRRLQVQFNGDRAATDRARVLRLAGTLHLKRPGQPHLVRCEALAGYRQPLTVETLEASLAHVTVIDGSGDRKELGDPELAAPSLDWLKRALELVDPNELDRDAWISTTAAFKQSGWTLADEAAVREIWDAWCARYDPGTTGADGRMLANDAAENEKQWRSIRSTELGWPSLVRRAPAVRAALSFGLDGPNVQQPVAAAGGAGQFFVHVLDGDDGPLRYHIDGLIPEDGLIPVFGAPKQGKTHFVIDVACSVATGTNFHGRPTTRGPVIYVAGEGFRSIKRRFKAWEEVRGVSLANAPIFRSPRAVQMLNGESAEMLNREIEFIAAKHGAPALIIIDTLARNFGPGDENATKDMTDFVAALDAMRSRYPGCSVLVVHHSGVMEKGRARGSSVLLGAADAEFRVEMKDGRPTVYCTAMKDGAPPPAMQFEMIAAAGSVALEHVGEPGGIGGGVTPSERTALTAFDTAAVDGVASLESWRAVFYEMHESDSPDTLRSAFKRGRERVLSRGSVVAEADGRTFKRLPMPGTMPAR